MGSEGESRNGPVMLGGSEVPGRSAVVAHMLWIFGLILILDLYALWFVRTEQTLYHADQVAYWSYSMRLAHLLAAERGSPGERYLVSGATLSVRDSAWAECL